MNKKLILKKKSGETIYCVISSEESYEKQLNKVFGIDQTGVYCFHPIVELGENYVDIIDNRTREGIATFDIVSFEYTDEDVVLKWQNYACDKEFN